MFVQEHDYPQHNVRGEGLRETQGKCDVEELGVGRGIISLLGTLMT